MTASPVIRSYKDLIQALDPRRRDLGMSMHEVDERAGFHSGYAGHLFAWDTKSGRGLGKMSLGVLLETMGLGLVVVELEKVQPAKAAPRCGMVSNNLKRPEPAEAA